MKPKKKMGCVFLGVLCSQNTLVLYCTQILRIVEVVLGSTQIIGSEPVYYTSTVLVIVTVGVKAEAAAAAGTVCFDVLLDFAPPL